MASDVVLGQLSARRERPQTRKFAWPLVVLPELFCTQRHLTMLVGYLVSIGWEVYSVELHSRASLPPQGAGSQFDQTMARLRDALAAIGSELIAVGHGLGGLFALKAAESSPVRAAVALAPMLPGVHSPLSMAPRRRALWWYKPADNLPTSKTLLELVSEADAFQREALIAAMAAADGSAAMAAMRNELAFSRAAAPRLIIAGGADRFAPSSQAEHFAREIGAQSVTLDRRGHWLIGGRVLERTIAEMQRFLVRALGEDLLLLYPEADDDNEKPG